MRDIEEIEADLEEYQEAYKGICDEMLPMEIEKAETKEWVDKYTKELQKAKLGLVT